MVSQLKTSTKTMKNQVLIGRDKEHQSSSGAADPRGIEPQKDDGMSISEIP